MAGRAWSRDEAIAALEAPDRKETQDPERLFDRILLTAGATVVEVGAGTGYFAIPAARRVGPSGTVYAVDLSPDLVQLLKERATAERLPQLHPVQSSVESIPLDSRSADWVLLANVLHDIPESTLAEAVRLLKPSGRLANIDWKKEETFPGPPMEIRLSPGEARRRLVAQGLKSVDEWEFGPWHYALLLQRRG